MSRRKSPPVVIGPELMRELGEDCGRIIARGSASGIRVVMDPFGLDDTPLDVQRFRWKALRESVTEADRRNG